MCWMKKLIAKVKFDFSKHNSPSSSTKIGKVNGDVNVFHGAVPSTPDVGQAVPVTIRHEWFNAESSNKSGFAFFLKNCDTKTICNLAMRADSSIPKFGFVNPQLGGVWYNQEKLHHVDDNLSIGFLNPDQEAEILRLRCVGGTAETKGRLITVEIQIFARDFQPYTQRFEIPAWM